MLFICFSDSSLVSGLPNVIWDAVLQNLLEPNVGVGSILILQAGDPNLFFEDSICYLISWFSRVKFYFMRFSFFKTYILNLFSITFWLSKKPTAFDWETSISSLTLVWSDDITFLSYLILISYFDIFIRYIKVLSTSLPF